MERLNEHEQLQELLGAYALDAVEPDEAAALERHLAMCPRCRAELAEHREVAGLLGYAGAAAPEGVWDRIIAGLEEPPPAMRLARMPIEPPRAEDRPRLVTTSQYRSTPERPSSNVVPIERSRRKAQRRLLVAAVTVAALFATALGIGLAQLRSPRSDVTTVSALQQNLWDAAQHAPGARAISLKSVDGTHAVPAVVLPDGRSYLGPGDLPSLTTDETYQLWGQVGADRISLAVMGSSPNYAEFNTPPAVQVLALTIERPGGVVTSSKSPVATALVPT